MMLKILISLSLIPVVYLFIAVVLISLPFNRNLPTESIDFRVLRTPSQSKAESLIDESYTARDGSKIFYRYASGDSETVLILLHGSGSEGSYFVPLAEQLSATNKVTTVIPDLRGHGRSALSKMGDIEYLGQYEHDLEDLNSHLRAKYPDAKIILGGHSSGAGLAIKYGGSEHLPFDAFLLLAPYLGYKAPTVKPNSGGWVQVAKMRYIGLSMFNKASIRVFNNLPVLHFNRPDKWNNSLQTQSYSYRLNESFSPQNFAQNLQQNKRPMLVLVGRDDDAFDAEMFEPVFSEYAPQAKVHLVAGAKHLDLPNSQIAFTIMSEWLNRVRYNTN